MQVLNSLYNNACPLKYFQDDFQNFRKLRMKIFKDFAKNGKQL